MEKTDRPSVQLSGMDGNAFAIIARCKQAAKKAKWSPEVITVIVKEMMSGNYDHLLQTAMKYFDVE
jgi:hypothetical protein